MHGFIRRMVVTAAVLGLGALLASCGGGGGGSFSGPAFVPVDVSPQLASNLNGTWVLCSAPTAFTSTPSQYTVSAKETYNFDTTTTPWTVVRRQQEFGAQGCSGTLLVDRTYNARAQAHASTSPGGTGLLLKFSGSESTNTSYPLPTSAVTAALYAWGRIDVVDQDRIALSLLSSTTETQTPPASFSQSELLDRF